MSTAADRPAPEPARLLAALDEHALGDATPGMTVQSLKRGGLDLLLAGEGAPADLVSAWDGWERGRTPPGPLLDALEAAGIRGFLAGLDGG